MILSVNDNWDTESADYPIANRADFRSGGLVVEQLGRCSTPAPSHKFRSDLQAILLQLTAA